MTKHTRKFYYVALCAVASCAIDLIHLTIGWSTQEKVTGNIRGAIGVLAVALGFWTGGCIGAWMNRKAKQ